MSIQGENPYHRLIVGIIVALVIFGQFWASEAVLEQNGNLGLEWRERHTDSDLIGGNVLQSNPVPEYEISHVFDTIVTAYSSSPDETWGNPRIMADGDIVYDGAIACPRRYEFGTKMIIDGEMYTCHDRLAIKYDDRIDIWKKSKTLALEFGASIKKVYVIK